MTLKQIFKMWELEPENMVQARNNKVHVEKILLDRYGGKDIFEIDEDYARRLFHGGYWSRDIKVRVARILVQLLEYGSRKGYCKEPEFDYTVCDGLTDNVTKASLGLPQDKPGEKPAETQEAQEKDPGKPAEPDAPGVPRPDKGVRTGGRPTRRIAKLDPDTLEVLATYPSIKTACFVNGVKKLSGALSLHQKCHGFYYCYAEDAETFVPCAPKEGAKAEPEVEEIPSGMLLEPFTDEELFAEIRRRGYEGELHITKTVTI